ncbi:MAG: zinc ABC transporter substrate-binding protein [Candidatus Woesearchaeota archaeon]|nr:zinc ABC transporter substrate-binding protein [Candidatus Woesearchaeota archaeon]
MKHIISLALILMLAACATAPTPQATPEQLTIATTFYPLYDATKAIAGTQSTVFSVVPQGVEPHSYEPTPQDVLKVSKADVYVALGLEFERFEEELTVVGDFVVIDASTGVALLDATGPDPHDHGHHDEHEEEHHAEHGDEHEEHHDMHDVPCHQMPDGSWMGDCDEDEHHDVHTGKDPHIWVSPKSMITMSENIAAGLKQADPASAAVYEANAATYIAQLKELDAAFTAGLATCKKDTVLVNHAAFAYLAHDYGFNQLAIGGLEPDAEPTPQQIVALIEEAQEHDLKYVFYEELVDPRIAETIAEEVGAETLELNPIEGAKDPADTYVSIMQRNLVNLRLALECA